jgi:hypothetical protein
MAVRHRGARRCRHGNRRGSKSGGRRSSAASAALTDCNPRPPTSVCGRSAGAAGRRGGARGGSRSSAFAHSRSQHSNVSSLGQRTRRLRGPPAPLPPAAPCARRAGGARSSSALHAHRCARLRPTETPRATLRQAATHRVARVAHALVCAAPRRRRCAARVGVPSRRLRSSSPDRPAQMVACVPPSPAIGARRRGPSSATGLFFVAISRADATLSPRVRPGGA